MDTLIVHLLNALLYASVMFLIAGGLSLIYGVMRIVNLAHGNLYAFGAYVSAWAVGRALGGAPEASPWLYALLPVGAVAAAALGAVLGYTWLAEQEKFSDRPIIMTIVTDHTDHDTRLIVEAFDVQLIELPEPDPVTPIEEAGR